MTHSARLHLFWTVACAVAIPFMLFAITVLLVLLVLECGHSDQRLNALEIRVENLEER